MHYGPFGTKILITGPAAAPQATGTEIAEASKVIRGAGWR
jgi:hypothetical protein